MKNNIPIQPIILSGGSGTRLWPLSRESFPKQYLKLDSSSNYSFIQKTQQRLSGIKNLQDPIIICNEIQRFIVAEQMREINIKPKSIILEPIGRNTAPAIAIGALKALQEDKESILIILSSDHEIKDTKSFRKTIEFSINNLNEKVLLTLGIKPSRAETGYGYIETIKHKSPSNEPLPIKKFIEKPNLARAKQFIEKDYYLWNSGIFLFKASSILEELKKYEPELISLCELSLRNSKNDLDFLRLDKNYFRNCPNLSIDVAVMERTNKAKVIPLDAGWDDIGNWTAFCNLERKDNHGNITIGDVYTKNVYDSYLHSENNLLVTIGIKNLVVVQTNDATLIANKNEVQKIKGIVKQLNDDGRTESKFHRKVYKPWGYYNLIEKQPKWQIKEICLNPKSSISLQKHQYRSEHWIILAGKARVQLGEKEIHLCKNESTYIPKNIKHRLSNQETYPLILIEVQCGEYLEEDDIVRFEDDYGRTN